MSDTCGKRLRAAREARGLSLEDILAATKMRPNLIQALEKDDYVQFPSVTHARNSLKLYGKHLQIDVSDGLSTLAAPARIGTDNYQYLNVVKSDFSEKRPLLRQSNRSSSRRGPATPLNLPLVGGLLLLMAFIGYLAINLPRLNLSGKTEVHTSTPAPDIVIAPKTVQKILPEPTPATDDSPASPISEVREVWHPRSTPEL